jgi:hypothetical protein
LNNFNASVGSVEDISGRYHSKGKMHNVGQHQYKEKGSPAFAKEVMSVTDDNLTVSHTEDDFNKSSYRGTAASHPIKIVDKKSPSASGRDFMSGAGAAIDGQGRPGGL